MVPYASPILMALIAGMIGVSVFFYYRRRNAVRQFAFEHGFQYQKKGNADLLGVKDASFYYQHNRYRNVVSGNYWPAQSAPAKPTTFIYFEQINPGRFMNEQQKIESFVCFQIPDSCSPRPADTVRFAGLDVLGCSIEKLDNKIFVWQEGQSCPADGIGDFLSSAYSACRCQWEW